MASQQSESEIALQNPQRYSGLGLAALRDWLARLVLELAGEPVSLDVRFVSDRQMRELNRRFARQDRPTDVLSFAGQETPEGRHLGDLAISVPTARRQAAALDHSLERELRELLLHGVLHLLGHDHASDEGTMNKLELELRRRWIS